MNLRLSWGENYAPKSVKVKKAIKQTCLEASKLVHLYPGDLQNKLKKNLAQKYHIYPGQIVLGNGLEGIIHLIVRTLVKKGETLALLSPTFPVAQLVAKTYGIKVVKIPIQINEKLVPSKLLLLIKASKALYLAYPNNPTGQYVITLSGLKYLLAQYQGIVILDECYFGIGKLTAIDLLKKHPNLIILRSFSKVYGLAGLRVGFAIASVSNAKILQKYSKDIEEDQLNVFSCLLAKNTLPFTSHLEQQYLIFKKDFASYLEKKLKLKVFDTKTSFVLLKLPKKVNANKIVRIINRQYGYLLKDTSGYDNFADNILMFTVPPKQEWHKFVYSLKQSIKCMGGGDNYD